MQRLSFIQIILISLFFLACNANNNPKQKIINKILEKYSQFKNPNPNFIFYRIKQSDAKKIIAFDNFDNKLQIYIFNKKTVELEKKLNFSGNVKRIKSLKVIDLDKDNSDEIYLKYIFLSGSGFSKSKISIIKINNLINTLLNLEADVYSSPPAGLNGVGFEIIYEIKFSDINNDNIDDLEMIPDIKYWKYDKNNKPIYLKANQVKKETLNSISILLPQINKYLFEDGTFIPFKIK